jgi:rare lipoprotein A (peptidoglycan hydrolase)
VNPYYQRAIAVLAVLTHPTMSIAESASSIFFEDALRASAASKPAPQTSRPQPSPSRWRTVVIPAPLEPPPPVAGLVPRPATAPHVARPLTGYAHELGGIASYYWQDQMTSSGERFDRHGHTAAHKTLPLGTRVRVTNLTNGKSTVVRINDRGPFKAGRVIDLSEAAATDIAMKDVGLVRVSIEVVR